MSGTGSTTLAGKRERELTRNAYHGLGEGLGQAHVAAAELKGAPECRGREEVRIRLTELLESRLVEGFESLERDQQGFSSMHALLALVGTLGPAPGRKTVVLFSEGLAVPANVEATYQSLIGAANRARVSLYTVDAGGLRVESPGDELRRTLDTVKTRARDDSSGRLTEDDPMWLREKSEDALRLAPASTLVPLAEQTAGFAIGGTNDLGPGLARLQEELREHYRLSYTPRNRAFDGRFRTIDVRVRRPHGSLQARKGYLALRTDLPVPALSYEAAALARLDSGRGGGDVPLRVRGLQFPEQPGASARVPILVEVPSRGLRFDSDRKAGVFRQDFTILVLVRDAGGRVVAKTSQRYALSGPLPRLEAARAAQVLFYREVRLPPAPTRSRPSWPMPSPPPGARRARRSRCRRRERDGCGPAAWCWCERAEKAARPGGRARARCATATSSSTRTSAGVRRGPRASRSRSSSVPGPRRAAPASTRASNCCATDGRSRPRSPSPCSRSRTATCRSRARWPTDHLAAGPYELRVTLSDGRDAETRTTALAIGE